MALGERNMRDISRLNGLNLYMFTYFHPYRTLLASTFKYGLTQRANISIMHVRSRQMQLAESSFDLSIVTTHEPTLYKLKRVIRNCREITV